MPEHIVPGFEDYTVLIDGTVISYKCGKRLSRQTKTGRKANITLRLDKKVHKRRLSRLVAAAKYGRWPTENEHVRHKDGDCLNNHMLNLELGDGILNAIDDYIYGDKVTTVENLDRAIDLLMALREKMEA